MVTLLAGLAVAATGVWLLGLAVAAAVIPEGTARFLQRFASSARAHYTEQALRLTAGGGFILFASEMRFTRVFEISGWVVSLTAAILFLVPWTWHRRFAEWAVPLATRNLRLFGSGAFILGALVLYAMS